MPNVFREGILGGIEKMTSKGKSTNRKRNFVGGNRLRFTVLAFAAAFLIVVGWSFSPSSIRDSKVSAAGSEGIGEATSEMLAYALNFKSASNFGVFGGHSVIDEGSTEFRGVVGSPDTVRGATKGSTTTGERSSGSMKLDAVHTDKVDVLEPLTDSQTDFAQAKRDLLDAFSAVDQLPCTEVSEANLDGQRFRPGVYCLPSSRLAGRMTVDANGDSNARFVFRVDGTFTADDASAIERIGDASATNVYIFARDAVSIGADANIEANVISRDSIRVGRGSTVSGKLMGVNGDVTTNSNIVAAGTGYIEICKSIFQNTNVISPGQIFTFTVSGIAGTIQVPAGGCSAPIKVASGNVTVTETVVADTAVVSIVTNPTNRLVSSNLPLRQAVIAVPDGEVNNQTVVTFTNQPTRTGTIEICKFALDTDVSGFFNFTVQGAPGQTFSVPVGFCSGPITVTILQSGNGPFTANVTELAQATFRLESVTTFPATALNSVTLDSGFDVNGVLLANNTNGGYANVALNIAGGAANQTTVRFFNRSIPGRLKVCKITADTVNIPIGTAFTFRIIGTAGPAPGMAGTQIDFDVLAGPAGQGGFCAFAPGNWVIGTPLFIGEVGISAANTTTLPLGLVATQAGLRISAITATTPFVSASAAATAFPALAGLSNPAFINVVAGFIGHGVITARNTTAEVTFTNFVYRPAILKLCKIAAAGVAVGTPFTFTIAPADPTTTWPFGNVVITVPAGSCTFVNGPFPANANFPGVGLFNFGTSIIVTENAAPGTSVLAITSTTLTGSTPVGTLIVDLLNRRGTMTLNQALLPNNLFNEILFTNGSSGSPTASNVSLSGRVVTSDGRGIRNATITVDGRLLRQAVSTVSNPFGYFRIDDLEAGGSYVVTVNSKQYRFASPSRLINLTDNLADLMFDATQ